MRAQGFRLRVLTGLPIRYRLFGAVLLIMAVSGMPVVVGWVGVGGASTLDESYDLTAHRADMAATAVCDMRISQSQDLAIRGHLTNPDGSGMHRGGVAAVECALAALGTSVHDAGSQSAHAVAMARFTRWATLDYTIQTLTATGHIALATRLENVLGDALAQGISQLAQTQASAGAARTDSYVASVGANMGLIGLVSLIVAAARRVHDPVRHRPLCGLAGARLRIAAGALGTRVQAGGGVGSS